jgi:hypothetical protein
MNKKPQKRENAKKANIIKKKHSFLFLYFGGQCPWHLWAKKQAEKAARKLGGNFVEKEITDNPGLAQKYRMFFPFMTVIDGKIRVPSPVKAETLIEMTKNPKQSKPPTPVKWGRKTKCLLIESLTPRNIKLCVPLCIAKTRPIGDRAKRNWADNIVLKTESPSLGFIAFEEEKARGAVEYLPSKLVPYPLPRKSRSIAFITCIYPTEPDFDYKSDLLHKLLFHLKEQDYRQVQVVAGENIPFPNGPASFFEKHGFVQLKKLDRINLIEGEETLILMKKDLKQ